MKSYHQTLLLLLLLEIYSSSYTNTTKFWSTQLNVPELGYQAYAGYEQIDWYRQKGQSGMFYQLFTSHGHDIGVEDPSIPLIVWLQGGPGASSMFGAFTQIGPIRVLNGKVISSGTNSWNIMGHLLFIDQPLNVGFSYYGDRNGSKQVSSADQAAKHLVNFMSNLYATWPTLKKCPLYITGQSFAGHYIPAFGKQVLTNTTFSQGITLGGIAIGDGWTDPINQINFYDSYLWSVGVVDQQFRDVCTWFQTNAIINMYQGNYRNATSYFDFITNNDSTPLNYFGNISMFNFRNYNGLDESFAPFLQTNKQSLGAKVDYLSGNDRIYQSFAVDISLGYANDVIYLLQRVKVLIYNGQYDVVVNTAGVLQYLNSLNWKDIGQWKRTKKQIWKQYGAVVGWAKVSGNLWFVLVNKAGHMVPGDQPDSAFAMMGHFINNENQWDQ